MDDTPKLRIGVNLPTYYYEDGRPATWQEMRDLARLVEDAGIDSLWAPDGFIGTTPSGFTFGYWECWTVLSAAAAVTSRVTIGPFIACTGFHNPAHLAKSAATLDEISNGRLILAVGAGVPQYDSSWRAFGFPDDHPAGRFEEALQIISRLLKGETVTFEGHYYSVTDCEILPPGPRPGGIPIWAAGKGPRVMRATARWATALNLDALSVSPDAVREQLGRFDQACEEVGRHPATTGRTGYALVSFARPEEQASEWRQMAIKGDVEDMAMRLHSLHQAGMEHIVVFIDTGEGQDNTPYPPLTPHAVELFAPVLEILRKMS